MLFPILAQSQVKSKLWYDGNARVMYNRDALEGTLKETDTVSTRSNGGGFTILDLGFHFTPVDDIEIFSAVRWRESIMHMSNEGVSNFVEIGPGKVLAGMVKRTIKKANCFSINSIADIENLKNEFKK